MAWLLFLLQLSFPATAPVLLAFHPISSPAVPYGIPHLRDSLVTNLLRIFEVYLKVPVD
jgi:hypothetical protein